MPKTDGALVEKYVQLALEKNPNINITGISGDFGDGSQPYGFAPKQLLIARQGQQEISIRKLEAIATRLGFLVEKEIKVGDLIFSDKQASSQANSLSQVHRSNVAIAEKNAPAVIAEEGATVKISIKSDSHE